MTKRGKREGAKSRDRTARERQRLVSSASKRKGRSASRYRKGQRLLDIAAGALLKSLADWILRRFEH